MEEIVELIKNRKFSELKAKLSEMKSADISSILDESTKEDAVIIFRLLSKEKAGMTFSYMESDMREKLISDLTDKELKGILDELFMDDTVDLIEEMPSNVVKKILKAVNKEDRKTINELLKYPEDSAGSIMTTEFVDLKENMTIEQALDRIRKLAVNSETIYTCYVLNQNRILQGIVSIKEILLAKENCLISDLMETNIISVNTLEDQEEVAKKFDKYDLYALPVVDNENRLVGIVTDRDILLRAVACDKDTCKTTVSEIMTTQPCSCTPNSEITEAERLMSEKQIRRIPVTQNNKVIGILTLGDLATNQSVDQKELCDTIECICGTDEHNAE